MPLETVDNRSASCDPHDAHQRTEPLSSVTVQQCQRAAGMFRALGDPARLQLLALLANGELCVGQLAEAMNEGLSTISQRLRLLRSERLVTQRRSGKHVYYSLADRHIAELIANSLDHAGEVVAHGIRQGK